LSRRGKEEMTWTWQQPYEAALRERDPSRLPERLMLAEKAIVQRLLEIPEPAQDLPEGRALREALDRLYSLYGREHHPPGEIQEEEGEVGRQNWMRVAIPLAVGVTLASAMAWMTARRNDRIDAKRMTATAEMHAIRSTRAPISLDSGGSPLPNADSDDYGSPSASARASSATSGREQTSVTHNMHAAGAAAQRGNPNNSASAPTAQRIAETPDAITEATDPPANGPEPHVERALPQNSANESSASASHDSANQKNAKPESTDSPAAELQDEAQRLSGTVAVSASVYPSILVPPESRRQPSVAAETLQIGESLSRPAPTYPEDAVKQGVQGTVKLRAIVGKDGAVENVKVVSGAPQLASAAVGAVRQWRYKPTFLGDQPIEVAQDITIVFRLASATASAN
jgi:TonB family protein